MLTSNFGVLRADCEVGIAVFDDSFCFSVLRVPSVSLVFDFFLGSFDASAETLALGFKSFDSFAAFN